MIELLSEEKARLRHDGQQVLNAKILSGVAVPIETHTICFPNATVFIEDIDSPSLDFTNKERSFLEKRDQIAFKKLVGLKLFGVTRRGFSPFTFSLLVMINKEFFLFH